MSKNNRQAVRMHGFAAMADRDNCGIATGDEKANLPDARHIGRSALFQSAKSFICNCIFTLARTNNMVNAATLGELSI